jgi:hypothetical protein
LFLSEIIFEESEKMSFHKLPKDYEKTIKLTTEEWEFVYYQLCARRNCFEEEMMEFAQRKDVREVQRCADAIEKINKIIKKLLDS